MGILALGMHACGEPLVAPQLVQRDRVLAARVEVEDAPARAFVAPGQTATLRWFVVSPAGPPLLSWAFSLCVAEPVSRGLPICATPSFARMVSPEPATQEPRLEFAMPTEAELDGAARITANGIFCSSGRPILGTSETDPSTASCPDAAERPLLVTSDVFVERDGKTNSNPSFDAVEVHFAEERWAPSIELALPAAGCATLDLSVPTVRAGSDNHEISFALPESLREPLPTVSAHSSVAETLQLSHFVTAGDLERAYSIVDFSRPEPQVAVVWKPPPSVPMGGSLVRFYFVLRDGRGGVDWSTHAVCVVP